MTKQELVQKLNDDLSNEYKHMHFYLHSSFMIQGLHREELAEYLKEHAQSEFNHVQEFAKLIVGLGGVPTKTVATYPTLTDPQEIFEYALKMEDEVVANYVARMAEAQDLGGVDGTYVEIFLEDQVLDSRQDADNLREMVKKTSCC